MRAIWAAICVVFFAGPVFAEGERAGDFDYYVLALSWSPNWCLREGDGRDAAHCARGDGRGWDAPWSLAAIRDRLPSYCRTSARDPSRAQTAAMADIMGSGGLAWHQWKKHGRCSGLSAGGYFEASRDAYEAVTRPEVFRKLDGPVRLPALVVEEAFLNANPILTPIW